MSIGASPPRLDAADKATGRAQYVDDIQLPGMDGLTLTRQLKADPKTSDILIVAMTAFAMKGDEQKALDAGCDGYITKPINTRSLPVDVAAILAHIPADAP